MGRKRNTAKTGDKAVYNSRSSHSGPVEEKEVAADDSFLRLEESEEDESIEGGVGEAIDMKHNVMDLGIRGDSDTSDSDSSVENDDREENGRNPQVDAIDSESNGESSSTDSDDELRHTSNPRHWGRKKSSYYHGDTGDIEIGQDEDDAFVEEAAAKEVEFSRFQEMDEGDFMLPDEDDSADPATGPLPSHEAQGAVGTVRDVSNLSSRDKRNFIKKQHPELLPLASFFSEVCRELRDTTQVATNLLISNGQTVEVSIPFSGHADGLCPLTKPFRFSRLVEQSVGASVEGQQYLLTKSLLGNSTALNAALYLLLKSDMETSGLDDAIGNKSHPGIEAHPVMAQLQKCNKSDERFKEAVVSQLNNVDDQVSYLVKAAALMARPGQDMDEEGGMASTSESNHCDSDGENASNASWNEKNDHGEDEALVVDESAEVLEERDYFLLHEARFGLRASEVNSKVGNAKHKRKPADDTYFGDLEELEAQGDTRLLASTINSIEQRSKKMKTKASVEEIDDTEANDDLAHGLQVMEEELARASPSGGKVDDLSKGNRDQKGDVAFPNRSNDIATNFYNAVANRSKEKKMLKKKRYQVAPKFPVTDAEVTGERAISKAIMKNRGLVAHKAKINRNPRVKKREQYRKALIRRKGAVRDIRTDEGHKYGGEETGIKSSISRSRKL